QKLRYMHSVIIGLYFIHKINLIHKDLHLGNILTESEYIAYISDFGFCKPADESDSRKIYRVMPYMAPEILHEKEYTQKSDVYSFGIIMNEI
ncbi:kinase-like domain-containing protein, partial [Glomus cerebriforme]